MADRPYCSGEYADDLSMLSTRARQLDSQGYSVCVRTSAIYECLSYATDGSVRRTRQNVVAHGTAFGFERQGNETLLLTNQHVAEWPAVTDRDHPVDGVPAGCKRVGDSLKIVDNESDDYDRDDVPLTHVVTDRQLDAAVLRAKVTLPIIPWKIGRSTALKPRNVVQVRGFPLGAFAAINVGKVISAYDHDDYKDWDHDDFVIDALLSAGNSGSPVLAVSCATGEFELVGIYHAGYSAGSALNVVVGIEQLRDLMTTLKRSPLAHGKSPLALDLAARARLEQAARAAIDPFFPLGPLTAAVRTRADGALVFAVYSNRFPFASHPIFVYEDLPEPVGFGAAGRAWFGDARGLKPYARATLDAEAQAQLARSIDALRRDALGFFDYRESARKADGSREQFERRARLQRTLERAVEARRPLVQELQDVADRLAPRTNEAREQLDAALTAPPAKPEVPLPVTAQDASR
ncbi:MAG TPA: trypsin-like peptidase domain-containing protein [Polyangia bacterium]|nr:trypsin-like peptidase domain-containing protein [Polyangia bacterium]